jgi:hypothetical protein
MVLKISPLAQQRKRKHWIERIQKERSRAVKEEAKRAASGREGK